MSNLLLVMIGGAFGSAARYGLARLWPAAAMPFGWPIGTFVANLAGGLLMGLLAGWLMAKGGDERLRLLLGVGVLGGFTTFSSYSLEVVQMLERRDYGLAGLYAVSSAVLAILAVMIGLFVFRKVAG
ncbi:fluoride efflux transporter CrcB [Asticcacaulis sp. AND118]|uniref:fluoride efflux transporter CrcB n=1 Tax=Asticcacaulis sp. AND118 TaxID=2840468 RepID=UPI001CFF7A52|nr:fluoride efflux transporter CrcB [Asticcacaulis sp. AND118]UDF04608.1 fluoride efflux transporter CrcB [Asticcacaulis sp. AND118]